MILIYSEKITERIEYAFRFIFESILADQVQFTQEIDSLNQFNVIKINYSKLEIANAFKVIPSGLLHEIHLEQQTIVAVDWDHCRGFFAVSGSDIPFDIFAATFYLVSRYEEYLPAKRDQYKRFRAKYSTAYKLGFLEKPQVDIWAIKLANLLENKFIGCHFKKRKFQYQPTIDVDNAYAYKGKGVFRNFASALRDLSRSEWAKFRERYAVLYRFSKDPYDNYDFIIQTLKSTPFKPIFFFLLNKNGKRDRSLSYQNLTYRSLIQGIDKVGTVGIHPSYQSNKSKKQLSKEMKRFSSILERKPQLSRQHYLILSFPRTYRSLIHEGITDDYSMGYPTRPGFRASTCTPFLFFDMIRNQTTSLTIHSFAVMDVTLKMYNSLKTSEASKVIKKLMHETANVGGTFISLWHNESLSDQDHWAGWKQVYTEMTLWATNLYNEAKNH